MPRLPWLPRLLESTLGVTLALPVGDFALPPLGVRPVRAADTTDRTIRAAGRPKLPPSTNSWQLQ